MEKYPIDFVITWVDGGDIEWQKEKNFYSNEKVEREDVDDRQIRYEDLGMLRYWFRAVETYAPWVNKIFFVTWGHLPEWLNITNNRIVVVKHKDFIPEEYLPTFSSHTIELNLHRIEGLSEHFVYFNDDTFLCSYVKKEHFFKHGLPRDIAAITALWYVHGATLAYTQIKDTAVINKHFSKNQVIKKNIFKWFSLYYRSINFRTLALLPWPRFVVMYTRHLPTSMLKSTFDRVWQEEFELLDNTCKHRLRSYLDVNQWLITFWQICEGKFVPAKKRWGKGFVLGKENNDEKVCAAIKQKKYKMICIGEGDEIYDTELTNKKIIESFKTVLPRVSTFEKD